MIHVLNKYLHRNLKPNIFLIKKLINISDILIES